MLRLHDMIMSGGLDHALDVLTSEDFAPAAGGFRYLQLNDVAELVEQARGAPSDHLAEEPDARYSALIPQDLSTPFYAGTSSARGSKSVIPNDFVRCRSALLALPEQSGTPRCPPRRSGPSPGAP